MAKGFQDLSGVEPCFFRKGDRLIECGEPLIISITCERALSIAS